VKISARPELDLNLFLEHRRSLTTHQPCQETRLKPFLLTRDQVPKFCLFQQLQDDEVVDEISRIWGLGPWSAEMVLIGFLGRADVWSENDGALKRGLNLALGGLKSSHKVVELFKPYRTVLSRHIWKALDDGILTDSKLS
jgi:DNA-3-methyladenine glycosylase II